MGAIRTFLVGSAIGAGIAMLLAPRTGTETQAQLRERVKGLKDQYGDVLDQGRDVLQQGRIRATELIQSGRDIVDQTVSQGQQLASTAKDQVRDRLDTQAHTENAPRRDEAAQPPQQQ
jgi:gas vesicle protein